MSHKEKGSGITCGPASRQAILGGGPRPKVPPQAKEVEGKPRLVVGMIDGEFSMFPSNRRTVGGTALLV